MIAPNQSKFVITWATLRAWRRFSAPTKLKHLQELCRENTETAIQALIEVAANPDANPGARVAAACALLDRGYGRPLQQVHVEKDISISMQHLEASVELGRCQVGQAGQMGGGTLVVYGYFADSRFSSNNSKN